MADTVTDRRAVQIHAERRTTFDFGPPPYSNVLDVTHEPSGQAWSVRLSDHIPPDAMNPLFEMVALVGRAGDPEAMAFALAWCSAASEVAAVTVSMRREVPRG